MGRLARKPPDLHGRGLRVLPPWRATAPADPTVSEVLGSVVGVLIERACAACGRPGPVLCDPCVSSFRPAPAVEPPPGTVTFDALLRYDGAARDLILALKYHNTRPALGQLARALAEQVRTRRPGTVTFAPTTAARRRARGYDQAELLARAVARRLRVPCAATLVRSAGPAQTGRPRQERLDSPQLVARRTPPGSILLVDDVCTTGATLTAAAAALHAVGAGPVHACVLAVTPAAPGPRSLKTATVRAEDGRGGAVEPHEKRVFDATD